MPNPNTIRRFTDSGQENCMAIEAEGNVNANDSTKDVSGERRP
jgi:hypothetical protein